MVLDGETHVCLSYLLIREGERVGERVSERVSEGVSEGVGRRVGEWWVVGGFESVLLESEF